MDSHIKSFAADRCHTHSARVCEQPKNKMRQTREVHVGTYFKIHLQRRLLEKWWPITSRRRWETQIKIWLVTFMKRL